MYSYICVAIIPMLLCFGVYLLYEKTLLGEMEMQNEYVMNTVKKNSEHVLKNVKNLSFTLQNDPSLESVLTLDSPDKYWGDKAVYEITQKMENYGKYTIGYYSSIYIYLDKTDVVLSDMGILDSSTFYDMMLKPSGKSYEEWKKSVKEKNRLIMQQIIYNESTSGKPCRGIEYLFPIKDGEAMIDIIINENAVFGDIMNTEWGQESEVYLYNSDDKLILSNCENPVEEYLVFSKPQKSSKKVRLTAFVTVDSTNWKIVTEVAERLLYRAKYLLRWSFILFIFLGLIISMLVIRRFLNRNYEPVSGLLELVNSEEKNEFVALKNSITNILMQNSMLSEQNEIQAVKLHRMILEKTIKGDYGEDFIYSTQMDIVDILFNYPCFSVAILKIADNQLFGEEKNIHKKERNELINISIGNLVSETCKTYGCMGEFLRMDENFVCVINYDREKELYDIDLIIDDVISKAKEYFDIKIYRSLSMKEEGMDKLSKCYKNAVEAYKYQKMFNVVENINYSEYIKEKTDVRIISTDEERKLINIIDSWNISLIRDTLNHLFERLSYTGAANLKSVEHFIETMKNLFTEKILKNDRVSQEEKENLIKEIESAKYIKDVHNKINEVLQIMCGDKMKGKPSGKAVLVSNIKKYVEENYSVGNLSVSMIADEFNLNASYIIKTFKEHTSMTLLEYISAYRIEKALELINNTPHSIEEIAQMTGFNHIRTFNRTFKKIMGVSPVNYRK